MVVITREEQLPIIKVVVAAGGTRTVSFPDEFFGECIDLRLTNLDGAANASYQMDGESQPLIILGGGQFVTFGGTRIRLITLNAAIGGIMQMEATVRTIPNIENVNEFG